MNTSSIISAFLYCLLMTIIIELAIALIVGIKTKKDVINVVLVQALTNPLVVGGQLFIRYRFGLNYEKYFIYPAEVLVVLVEGFIYSKVLDYKKINPYLLSLILNGCSYFIGLIIDYFI